MNDTRVAWTPFDYNVQDLHGAPRRPFETTTPGPTSGVERQRSTVRNIDIAVHVFKVPQFAVNLQPVLLKYINSYNTKEELLQFVSSYHFLLDPINLVTCIYKLARMFSDIGSARRREWHTELLCCPTFHLLIRTISSQFVRAQMIYLKHKVEVRGLDCRCVANLIWALVKLDTATEAPGLCTDLALSVSPFVLRFMPASTPQGLANLLWAYARLSVPPPDVIIAIVQHITNMLGKQWNESQTQFDAQALSNCVWAIAHLKSRNVSGLEGEWLQDLLSAVAVATTRLLCAVRLNVQPSNQKQCHEYLTLSEQRFSCQALVNIAWSFATIIGGQCAAQQSIMNMFSAIRAESIIRLKATSMVLQGPQNLRDHGGFNEQALSNVVYAFEKAGVLDRELLPWIFNVAALRLKSNNLMPSFKPQELCTLLRASHNMLAEPWVFLINLFKVISVRPNIISLWTVSEQHELHKARQLLQDHVHSVLRANSGGPVTPAVNCARTAEAVLNSLALAALPDVTDAAPSAMLAEQVFENTMAMLGGANNYVGLSMAAAATTGPMVGPGMAPWFVPANSTRWL